MTQLAMVDRYGVLTEPTTLQIQRLLPGPLERVWSYLTDGELRRQWFAGGEMEMKVGGLVELVWRNDELTDPPGMRPEGASGEHRMQSRVLELDPHCRLAIAWGDGGGSVTFELEQKGRDVLLTVTHQRVSDRASLLSFGSGWHAHLDILGAILGGEKPAPFWDEIARLKTEYERRFSG